MERKTLTLLALSLGLVFVAAPTVLSAQDSDTIIYLVRHGENVPTDPDAKPYDPVLSETGLSRAQDLARALQDVEVTGVFSTDLHRTLQTAGPLAERNGLEVEIYDPQKLDEFAQDLRARPGAYVVVGHSDTTPKMVGLLGGEPGEPIEHSEHDRLYILIFKAGSSTPTTLLLRYGAASNIDR